MYRCFDLETTTHTYKKRRASPFTDENWVVAAGYKQQGGTVQHEYFVKKEYPYASGVIPSGTTDDDYSISIPLDTTILVGFNIKFDLLWSWRHPELVAFFKRGGKVWCCQYAEYLLEGNVQSAHMAAMDDIVEKYGGELKIDEVKALWKAGVNTPDIGKDLLLEYLAGEGGDVENTERIFLGQVKRARELGILQGIMSRMDGLCATTECEYNGLKVDRKQAYEDRDMLVDELEVLNEQLTKSLPTLPDALEFNWGSPVMKSCLLYGGAIKYSKWTAHVNDKGEPLYAQKVVPCIQIGTDIQIPALKYEYMDLDQRAAVDERAVRYKSGKKQGEFKLINIKMDNKDKPKGAQKDYIARLPRLCEPKDEWKGELTDGEGGAIYSVGGEIIQLLAANNPDIDFLRAISMRDKVKKDLGTYYEVEDKHGVKKGMLSNLGDDDVIHHKLNHVQTVTSRLSSSDPNLQNVPKADFDKDLGRAKSVVKRMFVSRFVNGMMIESDYSQLEVVVQGLLTGDTQMLQDINEGVDFHVKRLSVMLGEPYDEVYEKCHNEEHPEYVVYKGLRSKAKGFTFARTFGAGKASIAANTGMSEDDVQKLIDAEEEMYPNVSKFFDSVEETLTKTKVPTLHREYLSDQPGRSVQCGVGYYTGITQARFGFLEVPAPAFKRKANQGKETAWYRPSIMNYPVQGTAGHLVQMALGKVWRERFIATDNYNGKAFLVNTVHDCAWVDAAGSIAEQVARDVTLTLESVPVILKETFGIDSPVPFPCEAEIGINLLSMKGL